MANEDNWKIERLRKCVEINSDTLHSNTDVNYQFRYIDISSVTKGTINIPMDTISFGSAPSRARRIFIKGDILFGTVRPYLQSHAYIDFDVKDMIGSTGFAVLRAKSKVDNKYLYHYIFSDEIKKQIDSLLVGSNYPAINSNDVGNLLVNLPPLPEQKKIAEILSTWDEAIETNETLISLYEKYLNSLALSLVKKKILINENVWKQTKLKDVFYDRKSYGCQSDNLKLHSLTIEDGVTAKTDRYNREFLVKGDSKKYKIAKLHDLVFNPQNLRYGAIAVNSIEHDVLLSPIYATLEIKDPTKYDIGYLGYLLTSKEMITFYDSIAEGTLVERMAVKPDVFLNQVFSIPDIATQKKIANILNTFKKKIDLFKKNKAELEKQKQGLMQRLLTGKVRVKLD